jgi:hypothetical protein
MSLTDSTYSGGMRVTNYSTEKLPIFDNTFLKGTFENTDAYETTLAIGTVMGRISATGNLVPFDADSSDGSQFPIAVLASTYLVDAGDEKEVACIASGEINANMLVFVDVADSLDTVVDSRQVRDHLQLAGFTLRFPDELSLLDNQ